MNQITHPAPTMKCHVCGEQRVVLYRLTPKDSAAEPIWGCGEHVGEENERNVQRALQFFEGPGGKELLKEILGGKP